MEFEDLLRNWEKFGKQDPLWAILTDPDKRGGKWDLDEFFNSGRTEITRVLEYAATFDLPKAHDRALDFGCGVGRLTQALCPYFICCDGVDIAASMIELAKKSNRYGDRCRYHVNPSNDLKLFPSDCFDLVYSRLVLQHMQPRYSKNYILEFIRVLRPGGLLVFQIPAEVNVEALPDSAFKAKITLKETELVIKAGSHVSLQVEIRNVSSETWPVWRDDGKNNSIRLGNRWLDTKGNLLVSDDGRVGLPVNLDPGESVSLPLKITVPEEPGRYILELDMVQEMVAWFKDKGSKPTHIGIEVHSIDSHSRPRHVRQKQFQLLERVLSFPRKMLNIGARDGAQPKMEMHGVPQAEVLRLMEDHHVRVIEVQDDHSAGPGWMGYCYWATKG